MKHLYIISSMLLAFSSASAMEMNISPGQLAELIPSLGGATSLYLIGQIDARDLAEIRNIPANISILDLTKTEVTQYNGYIEEFPGVSVFPAATLPDHLFFKSEFTRIGLPANLTYAGKGVCADCPNLVSVTVGEGLKNIPDLAFYGCPNLSSVNLPASIRYIGREAIANCPELTTLNLSHTALNEIADRAMADNPNLTSVSLPQGVTAIGSEIFYGSQVGALILPNVMKAAPFALAGMESLQYLRLNPYADLNMGLLMGDNSISYVENSPLDVPELYLANAPQADIGSSIRNARSIGKYAFAHNAVSQLTLSEGLEYLDAGVLLYADALTLIDAMSLEANVPQVHEDAFKGLTPGNIQLIVAKDCKENWLQHPVWSQFDIREEESGVEDIDITGRDIQIRLSGNLLSVSAAEAIEEVGVWMADGTGIFSAHPGNYDFSASLQLPDTSAIIIVKVTAGDTSRSVTFLTR